MTEQSGILITIPEAGGCWGGGERAQPEAVPTPPSKEYHCQRNGRGDPLLLCLLFEPYIWPFVTRKTFYHPSIQISIQELRTGIILVSVWQNPAVIGVEATALTSP